MKNCLNYDALVDALKNCVVALEKVQHNQAYQSKHGWPDFTSAPTEIEWKQESQEETDSIVNEAISKAKTALLKG